jgi:5-methylcytosine-specific restriction endonuclease McrA
MSRKGDYYKYLESGHWYKLRKAAFKRDGYKCTICGSANNLRGHHIRYRRNVRDCTVDDIQTMCNDCHEEYHHNKRALRKILRNRTGIRKLVNLIMNFDATDNYEHDDTTGTGRSAKEG